MGFLEVTTDHDDGEEPYSSSLSLQAANRDAGGNSEQQPAPAKVVQGLPVRVTKDKDPANWGTKA